MARPKVKEPKKPYSVMLKPSDMEKIDALAQPFDLDPVQLVWMVNEVGKLRETR